jgi:signal transduction histidine kinase
MLAGNPVKNPAAQPVDGFVRWVLAEKTGLLAESAAHTAQQFKITNPPAARTWIGVPLMSSGMVLGCMATWLDEGEQPGRTFGQRESETFTTIAAQVGAALANALLYREAQHHAAQLSKLNHISAVLNAARYPEKLLELVANSAIDVAGCDKVAIYLLDQDVSDPALILAHAKAFSPEHLIRSRDIAVPLTPTERRKVMDEGTSVRVHNIHAEDADISPAMMLLAAREKFSAYAHLPLRAQDRSIGMLAIYYDEPHAFAPGDLGLLETFANQAALAIANAQFFRQVDSQLTRHTDQAVRMSNITQRLNASLDLDQIFNLIIESAIEGCGADSGVLVLAGSPELDYSDISHPHMVAWRGFDPANTVRAPHMIAEELAKSPVLQKGEPRLVSHDDPKESSPRSQLGVPIFLEGEVTGAIVLESAILNAFTHDDLSFVGQLAVQAAIAIRNAKLYRHAQAVRDRLHAILDASNDGLLMFDPRMRIIMTNTRMGDFWDFARSDFSPPSPDQFIADPTSALGEGLGYKEGELQALVRRGIKNPQIKAQTDLYSTTGPGGHGRRFVERTATPVRDERGSFIGLLLIFRDVTDQKELEETRQTLTSMIVHDLRSPLQAVMGSMRLIAEVSPEGDPVIDQATEVSKRAVKKLLNLVNNLLDLSRMEQGEFVLDPGIEQVRPILADVVEEVLPLAREMDAVVQLEVPDSLPYIRVDRDMVGRVALNLLDNALKYTEPGTLVKVGAEVRRKGEDDRQKDDMVCVFVADQGPGIPDEYKAAIFDRFAQVPGRKGRRRSAGLGLAFCQLAVESHGGRIWVEDGTEGGSVFKFTLPITAAPPEEHDEDEEPLPAAPAAQPPDSPSPPGEDKPAS